jgi:hypothetical protein
MFTRNREPKKCVPGPFNSTFNSKYEYGKAYFAEYVVKKNEKTVNFDGFAPILSAIRNAIGAHAVK